MKDAPSTLSPSFWAVATANLSVTGFGLRMVAFDSAMAYFSPSPPELDGARCASNPVSWLELCSGRGRSLRQ